MKRLIVIIQIVVVLGSLQLNARTNWFSDYVKININGEGTSAPTGWYWIGMNPDYGTPFDGTHLGNQLNSLVIEGCDMKYGMNLDKEFNGGSLFYKVTLNDNPNIAAIPTTEIPWSQTHIDLSVFYFYHGTTSWNSKNIIKELEPNTTYQLHVWAKATFENDGKNDSIWLPGNGKTFVATFTTAGTFSHTPAGKINVQTSR